MIALLIVAITMFGYVIYKMNKETPTQKMEREKKDLINRETKHYSHLFNYNVDKAYGGD